MMTARNRVFLIVSGIMICALFSAACVSTTFGDVAYSGGNLTLSISHDGPASAGYIQVTVYEVSDNKQEQTGVFFAPLDLQQGINTAIIAAPLEPGKYKLYFYLIQNGERKGATIRDIEVR